jgi:hypothetical protein
MKTPLDSPFPTPWTADELADAVPRPLSSLFDVDFTTAVPAPHVPAAVALARRYAVRSDMPGVFQVR